MPSSIGVCYRPPGLTPELAGVHAADARTVVHQPLRHRGEGWLPPPAAASLLAAAGIVLPPSQVVATPEAAAAAAEVIGFPAAVKVVSSQWTHKSDVGGGVLDLDSATDVHAACERMRALMPEGLPVEGFLVQQMVEEGIETIVGVADDANFGPLVAFGLGGTAVEVLNDVALRITPLTDAGPPAVDAEGGTGHGGRRDEDRRRDPAAGRWPLPHVWARGSDPGFRPARVAGDGEGRIAGTSMR